MEDLSILKDIPVKEIIKAAIQRKDKKTCSYFEILADIATELKIDAYELGLVIKNDKTFMQTLQYDARQWNILDIKRNLNKRLDEIF